MGSNSATPTLNNKTEAVEDTAEIKEPSNDTQSEQQKELLKELLNKF